MVETDIGNDQPTVDDGFDADWIVVGSGFGGSVSSLRLSERGWDTLLLECGRRFRDEDYARSTWNLRRYFWAPRFGLRGIMRLSLFKDVFIATGAGVGGGSLGYANTLYRPRDDEAASSTVAARAFAPISSTSDAKDSGPRELLIATS